MSPGPLVPTAIFVSGNGTNLQTVIDETRAGRLPLDIRLVISNSPSAYALERSSRAGIESLVATWDRTSESRAAYAARLAAAVNGRGAQLVLLLGWMHVLAPAFLGAGFEGVLNLHPSYLPDDPRADEVTFPDGTRTRVFRGARALRDAIEAGVPITGATLIEVTPDVDRGPVLARRTFALGPEDDEASALARLRDAERDVVVEGIVTWLKRKGRMTPA